MAQSNRIKKVNELLQREISMLFARELEFPKGTVATITEVETEQKLDYAQVYVSIYPPNQKDAILALIGKRIPYLQSLLNHRLHMTHVPQLRFAFDEKSQELFELDALIDTAQKDLI
ncbi:MAG: 30S ribosome-binding factor RbfA [Patescibacteria group bacterium]